MPLRTALFGAELGILGLPSRKCRQFALTRTAALFPRQGFEDLLAARREGFDRLTRDTLDLEGAIYGIARGRRLVTELLDPCAQLGVVDRAEEVLAAIELIVAHRMPLAIGRLGRIGDHRVDVQLRLVVSVHIVQEGRNEHVAGLLGHLHLCCRIPDTCLDQVLLGPYQGRGDGIAEGADDPVILPDQRQQ